MLASIEGLVQAAVLSLTALGLSLVFGVMRVVNVAHGEFFMLGAVIAYFVATTLGQSPAIGFIGALIAAPLVAALIAVITDFLVLKRINYDPEATIVATIGLLYIPPTNSSCWVLPSCSFCSCGTSCRAPNSG